MHLAKLPFLLFLFSTVGCDPEPVSEPVTPASQPSASPGLGLVGATEGMALLPTPKPLRVKGRDFIKVKIFPHKQKDLRTGEPDDPGAVTISGSCKEYAGRKNSPRRSGKVLRTGDRFAYELKSFGKPRWLVCRGGATVVRGSNHTNHKYEGAFYIRKTVDKAIDKMSLQIINVLPIDVYLRGVVPTEVIPSWPVAVLKAQSVAARTYAYYNIADKQRRGGDIFYDVDDTARYQAYSGISLVTPATDKAVAETRGLILTFQSKVILAFFDTDAGGTTASAREVFGLNAPYCASKAEPDFVPKPWKVDLAATEILEKLRARGVAGGLDGIKSLTIVKKTESARSETLLLTDNAGKSADIRGADFQRALGLKSLLFTVSQNEERFSFAGTGAGHGVGLSQMGAKAMAVTKNWDFRQILAFYYSDTNLCNAAPVGGAPGYPICK